MKRKLRQFAHLLLLVAAPSSSGTPDNARVTTSGAVRVTTGGAVRVWTAPTVELPDVASATRLLDLQADALVLSDGAAVSTWADASGLGHDFTQSGSARPTYHTGGGVPYVQFDGVDDCLIGPDVADNLDSFALFLVSAGASGPLITKINNNGCVDPGSTGWVYYSSNGAFWLAQSSSDSVHASANTFVTTKALRTVVVSSRSALHFYTNGAADDDLSGTTTAGAGVTSYSTTEPIRLGVEGDGGDCDGFSSDNLYAVMLFSPAPNASDRAAIEAYVAAKYGITL